MPRTGKKKRVLKMPQNSHFISRGTETEYGINMKVEEYLSLIHIYSRGKGRAWSI